MTSDRRRDMEHQIIWLMIVTLSLVLAACASIRMNRIGMRNYVAIALLLGLLSAACAGAQGDLSTAAEQDPGEATAPTETAPATTSPPSETTSPPSNATSSPWVLRSPNMDPSSTVLELLVSEQNGCTSGRRADDRISYQLDATSTEVSITALTTALEGDQECPGNPFTPLSVDLGEPLGDRALIDGSGKEADPYVDYSTFPIPLDPLTTEQPLPPIIPATTVTSESSFFVEARCEVAEDSFEDRFATGWDPDGMFAEADHVISSAVAGFGLSTDGWHVVENTDDFGLATRTWTQYVDGVPKASLRVSPSTRGWGATGSVCDLGGPLIPDAEPPADREFTPPTAPASELADVAAVLEQIESLSQVSNGWAFPEQDRRCASWIQLEHALEETGHVINSWYELETIDGREIWQVRVSVVNQVGERAVLSTSGERQISVFPSVLPQQSAPRGLPRQSFLLPCWLDSPIPPDSN